MCSTVRVSIQSIGLLSPFLGIFGLGQCFSGSSYDILRNTFKRFANIGVGVLTSSFKQPVLRTNS